MLEYALENRKIMMEIILDSIGLDRSNMEKLFNETHNHAISTPDGVLHRKGATPADKDQIGVIPGNMKAGTYITRGLGNTEYLSSSSHGAGRILSRTAAKEKYTEKELRTEMEGIFTRIHSGMIDEIPMAYKDLDYVILLQQDIVIDVIDKIKPLINIKS